MKYFGFIDVNRTVYAARFFKTRPKKSFGFLEHTIIPYFLSRHLLKIHERTHSGENGFICDECGDVFGTRQLLEYHMSKHSGQYNFNCPDCNRGFNSKSIFYEHTLTHSGDKPFECEKCGQKFSNRGTFWAHKKRHENPKPYECQVCQKTFSHSSHLSVHKRTHTGIVIDHIQKNINQATIFLLTLNYRNIHSVNVKKSCPHPVVKHFS